LKAHLPEGLEVKSQEQININEDGSLYFNVDLVLYDVATNKVHCVLDTKYKIPQHPAPSDIAQIMAYAQTKGTDEGILIYPKKLPQPLDSKPGNGKLRIRSLTFSLDGDLEQAGATFLDDLLKDQ
jgi:5-methylcytosine-specific restriction enzyme subunit McrC